MAVEGRADRVDLGVERQARRADRAEVHEEDPAVREEVAPRAERLGADAVLGLERRASGRDRAERLELDARGRACRERRAGLDDDRGGRARGRGSAHAPGRIVRLARRVLDDRVEESRRFLRIRGSKSRVILTWIPTWNFLLDVSTNRETSLSTSRRKCSMRIGSRAFLLTEKKRVVCSKHGH